MALTPRQKTILIYCMVGISALGLFVVIATKDKDPSAYSIEKIKWSGENVLVIDPRLTAAAYSDNGFYAYYNKKCDTSCLTIPLRDGPEDSWGPWNKKTVALLKSLNYPMMDDSAVHLELLKNPDYLNRYDTIILLHSEYVTKELYQGITNHRHVIYLAPNALYAEITFEPRLVPETSYDGWGNVHVQKIVQPAITLIRGHNYPTQDIRNGFGWEWDNSPEEYDLDCAVWKFRNVTNGQQLNCVQEIFSQHNPAILAKMKKLIQD